MGTSANTSPHEIANSLSALAGSKVLAALVLGGRALLEFFNRRRVAGLTNRVLSSSSLAGAESARHGGSRESDRSDESRPGAVGHLTLGIDSKRRKVLLVAAAESVGGWRRKGDNILRRCARLLGGRRAARTPRAGVDLIGRRYVEHGGVDLGGRRRKAGSRRGRRVRQVGCHSLGLHVATSVLLEARVHDVLVLAGHLVENKIDAGLSGFLDGGVVLELLAVSVHLGRERRGRKLLGLAHAAVQVHAAKLLGSQGKKLLLELLLPLGEVQLGSQQLGSNAGIHLAVVVLQRGRSQDLVVERGLLVVLGAGEAVANGSLGDGRVGGAVVALPGEAGGVASTNVVLALGEGGRRGGWGRRGRLGRSAQASEQVGTARARRGNRVLSNRGDLGRRGNAEALQSSTLASRPEARGRAAEAALGLEVGVSHLSKTASVHAHCDGLVKKGPRKGVQRKVCRRHTGEGSRREDACRRDVQGAGLAIIRLRIVQIWMLVR